MLALAQLNQNVWWYFARAGGLVAWGLLAASVFWGLIYAGRLTRKVPPPAWNLDIHRFLGALSVTFVVIHVAALTADKYVNFGLSQVLMPFATHWRPGAVAWGITAFYLLVAVEATSLAKRWLPKKLWRRIHLLSFAVFAFSTVHGIQTGTDTANPLVQAIGIALLAAATITAALRIAKARRRPSPRRRVSASPPPTRGGPEFREVALPTIKAAAPAGRSPRVPRFAEAGPPTIVPVPAASSARGRPKKVPRFAEPPPAPARDAVESYGRR